MDRRERMGDLVEGVLAALGGHQAGLWTALPCTIKSFDAVKMTVEAKPAIKAQVRSPDGVFSFVDLPLLVDCPVLFPGGGGFTLTFPIAAGDECLMVLASRCIDGWWQSGMATAATPAPIPPDLRMHDLSDGFAIVGVRSQPRVLPNVSTNKVQLRLDDGTAFLDLDSAGHMRLKATSILLDGPVHATSTILAEGEITAVTTPLHTHRHGNVTNGGGTTDGPTP